MARILVVSVVWSVSLAIIEDFVRTLLLSLSSSKKTLLLGPPLMVMGRSNKNVFYLACCWMWLFVCQTKASGAFFLRTTPIAVSSHQARPSSLGCHSHRRTTSRRYPRRSKNTILLLAAFQKENDSTSDRVSSPERYAQSLNLTIAQVQERIHQRQESVDKLQRQLQHISNNNNNNPLEKQALLCRHRYEHGQHPFVCRKCWTYQSICLCRRQQHMTKQRTMITLRSPCHSIVLWTHRQEWGSVSNTGSILPLILKKTCLLMKGLPEHEEEWKNLLQQQKRDDDVSSSLQSYPQRRLSDDTFHEADDSSTSSLIPIVLWPQNNKKNNTQKKNPQQQSSSSADSSTSSSTDDTATPTYWTMDDIRQMARDNPQQQFVLVAVEGTWRQARRMVSSDLLQSFPRLSLAPVLQQQETNNANDNDLDHDIIQSPTLQQSLLAPLRNKPGSLCTAEAVAYALQALEWITPDEAEAVLDLARTKVDRVRRYQGKLLL